MASSIGAIGQKAIDTPHGWRALAGAWIAAQQRQLILFAPVAFAGGIALWFGLPFNSQRQAALLLALAIAFPIAAFLKPRAGVLGRFAYPLAGWAGVALAIFLMKLAYGFSPLAGARTGAGFLTMSLAGFAGGLLFAWMARRRT